jgi:hypothetical protein
VKRLVTRDDLVAIPDQRGAGSPSAPPAPQVDVARAGGTRVGTWAARWAAIVAIEVVIVIHLVLTPMHLTETFYIGVLFSVGNGLLFAAILLMVAGRWQAYGWLLGALVCAGEFVGFVLSRTVGLPQGYHEAWASAPEDYLGLASLFFELVVVVIALDVWRRAGAPLRRPARP